VSLYQISDRARENAQIAHEESKAEAKHAKERIIAKRTQELSESVKFASDAIADSISDATSGMYPRRAAKAQEMVALIMAGGSGEEVCDWLRSHVEQKAAEKALDEYEETYGVDD